jgi:hypothetical protein
MRSFVAKLALMLLVSGIIFSQEKPAPVQPVHGKAAKTLTVYGKVSDDGKSLFTELDSEWALSNPEALKGHEGRMVTVKCYVDTERNRIQIVSVRKGPSGENYAGRSMDSAFRR